MRTGLTHHNLWCRFHLTCKYEARTKVWIIFLVRSLVTRKLQWTFTPWASDWLPLGNRCSIHWMNESNTELVRTKVRPLHTWKPQIDPFGFVGFIFQAACPSSLFFLSFRMVELWNWQSRKKLYTHFGRWIQCSVVNYIQNLFSGWTGVAWEAHPTRRSPTRTCGARARWPRPAATWSPRAPLLSRRRRLSSSSRSAGTPARSPLPPHQQAAQTSPARARWPPARGRPPPPSRLRPLLRSTTWTRRPRSRRPSRRSNSTHSPESSRSHPAAPHTSESILLPWEIYWSMFAVWKKETFECWIHPCFCTYRLAVKTFLCLIKRTRTLPAEILVTKAKQIRKYVDVGSFFSIFPRQSRSTQMRHFSETALFATWCKLLQLKLCLDWNVTKYFAHPVYSLPNQTEDIQGEMFPGEWTCAAWVKDPLVIVADICMAAACVAMDNLQGQVNTPRRG